jgi:hypothetical protein|nr:MAG TPA: hypothetical protein [Caudoviricetes sp.]
MSHKFSKNRKVDKKYYTIPMKYCLNVPTSSSKDFVILDDYGKFYACAWRNSDTGRVGISFLCRKVYKKHDIGFIYKDKFYSVKTSGWVI